MSTIILLAGFVSFVVGLVGVIRPSAVRMENRWQAIPVICGMLAAIGVAQLLFADTSADHPNWTRAGGALKILIWLAVLGFCANKWKAAANRPQRVELSPEVRQLLDQHDDEADYDELEGVDDVLQQHFSRYRANEITLDDYRAIVQRTADEIDDEIKALRQLKSRSDVIDERLFQLDDDAIECSWRLEWIEKEAAKPEPDARFAPKGKWARFEYVDADGVVTNRTIANWERRGVYIVGYDRSRKEERTFRQDRIDGWISG